MEFGTDITINVLWAALLGYAFGSIPFGLILGKLAGKGDIRERVAAISALRTCCAPAANGWLQRRCYSIWPRVSCRS